MLPISPSASRLTHCFVILGIPFLASEIRILVFVPLFYFLWAGIEPAVPPFLSSARFFKLKNPLSHSCETQPLLIIDYRRPAKKPTLINGIIFPPSKYSGLDSDYLAAFHFRFPIAVPCQIWLTAIFLNLQSVGYLMRSSSTPLVTHE